MKMKSRRICTIVLEVQILSCFWILHALANPQDSVSDQNQNQNQTVQLPSQGNDNVTTNNGISTPSARTRNSSEILKRIDEKIEALFASQLQKSKKGFTSFLHGVNLNSLRNAFSNDSGIVEEDLTADLEAYEAPLYIRKNFPYYLSGYDEERRPVYVAEIGKMDLRSVVELGVEAQEELIKYSMQGAFRLLKKMREQGADEMVGILDSQGMELRQITSMTSLGFLIKLAVLWRDFTMKHIGGIYVVNANFVTEQLANLARPIMGHAMEKVEVLGNNKPKWISVIRRAIGPKNLPPWYGGVHDFVPVAVY